MPMKTWNDVTASDWLARQHERTIPFELKLPPVASTLYGWALRLLDRQSVAFVLPNTKFGTIELPQALFSLEFLAHPSRDGMMERHVILADGRRVSVRFDLKSGQIVLNEPGADEAYVYTVNQWVLGDPTRLSPLTLEVPVLLDVTPGVQAPSPVLIQLDWVERFILEPLRFGEGLSLNKISRLTGVAASTLSRVKNQPETIQNLPVSTLVPLSTLAQLLDFEDSVRRIWDIGAPVSDEVYGLVVTTTTGVYRVASENRLYIERLHLDVLDTLASKGAAVTLADGVGGVSDGESVHESVTFRTDHIVSVVLTHAPKTTGDAPDTVSEEETE